MPCRWDFLEDQVAYVTCDTTNNTSSGPDFFIMLFLI